jgi:hypothetical protein
MESFIERGIDGFSGIDGFKFMGDPRWDFRAPAKFSGGKLWATLCTLSTVGGKKKDPHPPEILQGCESIEVMRCGMHKDVIPW